MADKFLVYDKEDDAKKVMSDVWEAYKIDMEAKGFPVVNGEIVPKNAATGLPDYAAQRTIAWDAPAKTIDGKFVVEEPPQELKAAITVTPSQELSVKPALEEPAVRPETAIEAPGDGTGVPISTGEEKVL